MQLRDAYNAIARYYDLDHATVDDDLFLYRTLASATGGPVLDVGAGTGRIALALAREGLAVTAVDLSPAMLATGREKARKAGFSGKITWVEADARAYRGREPAHRLAVIGLNSFMHFSSTFDQQAVLRAVAANLHPEGVLAVDLPNPEAALALGATADHLALDYARPLPERGVMVTRSSARAFSIATQEETATLIYEESPLSGREGPTTRQVIPLTFRHIFRYELELLLRSTGWLLTGLYGTYDQEDFDAGSPRMVAVAERQSGRQPEDN